MRLPLLLAAALAAALAACGNSGGGGPDAAVFRAVFEKNHARLIDEGLIAVQDFRIVESGVQEAFGVNHHRARYEAQVRWLRDNSGGPDGPHKAGEIETRSGTIQLEQADGGWRAPDGQVYPANQAR